ncbi:MAG: hypothetical protein WBA51_08945, partial [Erythrobacter sp.]
PIANDPHGGSRASGGKKLIAILDTLPEGEPVDIRAAMRIGASADAAEEAGETDGGEETEGPDETVTENEADPGADAEPEAETEATL